MKEPKMHVWAISLTVVGIAYFLWFLFVLALVSSLNEIKKSTWHYRIYSIFNARNSPKNSCDYGKILTITPALFAFIGVLLTVWSVFIVVRFIFNWVVWPFFTGRAPKDGLSKNYFHDLIDFDTLPHDIGASGISTKKFMKLSPFLWIMILAFVSAAIWESYRVVTGSATKVELNILLSASGVSIIALAIIWLVKKPSVKTMYAIAKEKLCRNIPVVG